MKCYTCVSKKCDCLILPYKEHTDNILYYTNRFNFHGQQCKSLEKKIYFYRHNFINVDNTNNNTSNILNVDEFLNPTDSLSYAITEMIEQIEKHKKIKLGYYNRCEIEKKKISLIQKNNIAYVLSRLNLPIDIYYHTIQFVA